MCFLGRNPRNLCRGCGPGWRIGIGGECSKLEGAAEDDISQERNGSNSMERQEGLTMSRKVREPIV